MNGNKLKQFREEKNLTQAELARITGVDRSYINKIERGKLDPSLRILSKLAKALEKPIKDFF